VLGGGFGLATGLVVALFPFAAIGGGLPAATTAAMLNPDDQRRLAAIEEQLLIDDPALAQRLARDRSWARCRCRNPAAGLIAALWAVLAVSMLLAGSVGTCRVLPRADPHSHMDVASGTTSRLRTLRDLMPGHCPPS
jgi:hypothetical protein